MHDQIGGPRDLTSEDTLLRALRRSDERKELKQAFMLRQDERQSGLSVNFDCSAEQCRDQFKKSYGVVTLVVRDVNDLGLEVVPDQPHHANIHGIPHKDDDPETAEHLANSLAQRAILISDGLKKNAHVQPLD